MITTIYLLFQRCAYLMSNVGNCTKIIKELSQITILVSEATQNNVNVCNMCGAMECRENIPQWRRGDACPSLNIIIELDESTARRQLKSPQSLSGRSIHLKLVTKWSWSWSWMTYCHLLCGMSIDPPILRYSYFKIWPWKSIVKVMCEIKGQAHVWPSKFKGHGMVKFKPIGHIWGLGFNRYVCFSFPGNRTIFGWDIANSIFDLENSRSRSWPRSNPMVTSEP